MKVNGIEITRLVCGDDEPTVFASWDPEKVWIYQGVMKVCVLRETWKRISEMMEL